MRNLPSLVYQVWAWLWAMAEWLVCISCFSLLLSMIFTKKIASSPLVMWFELSMFVRYGWAFGTRVLKTRVPELVLSESFFSNDIKLTYFLGLDTETFFPPNKKGFWELLWGSKWCMKPPESWSSQLRILFWVKQKRFWPHQASGAS